MKIALIIVTIILIFSFIIRQGIVNIGKTNPKELINNYAVYNTLANINGLVFVGSIIAEVVLLVMILL